MRASMKAMILAAGRGERMRPLTDTTPKPLLKAGGKALIVWHLERLAYAGFKQIIINHAWLGGLVEATLASDAPKNLGIRYSPEGEAAGSALETAGGIANALPLITTQDEAFLVINGDIWCDFDPARALTIAQQMMASNALAHLVMVPNPPQHPDGDFLLTGGRISDKGTSRHHGSDNGSNDTRGTGDTHGTHTTDGVRDNGVPRLTFSGIGVYRPGLFKDVPRGSKAKLAPLLRAAMHTQQVSGELHTGQWEDIGTPERLAQLDARLRNTMLR